MKKPSVVVLDENHPVPTRSLWKLLNWITSPEAGRTSPLGEDRELSRAYHTATKWLARVERESGLPSFVENPDALELDPTLAALGTCPFCHGNDGVLRVEERAWGICHIHKTRWKCAYDFTADSFSPLGTPYRDEGSFSLNEYLEGTPVTLSPRGKALNRSPIRALASWILSDSGA